MSSRAALAFLILVAWLCGLPPAKGQSFDVASVKPATSGGSIACSGGPGTADPGLWRCSNMPLALVIAKAFRFQDYQFSTHDPCCLERFDIEVRVPESTNNDQFNAMLQNLLKERFRLAFHFQQKEMSIYELTVAAKGPQMKRSPPGRPHDFEPWWILSGSTKGLDKDGYPVFAEASNGLAGSAGHFRWTGLNVTTEDIAKTLSDQSNRPVVDATGLKGSYDVDLKWIVDLDFTLSERGKAELRETIGDLPDSGGGPTLVRAVEDQLGLRLNSKKGPGEIVVVDHVEEFPTVN